MKRNVLLFVNLLPLALVKPAKIEVYRHALETGLEDMCVYL